MENRACSPVLAGMWLGACRPGMRLWRMPVWQMAWAPVSPAAALALPAVTAPHALFSVLAPNPWLPYGVGSWLQGPGRVAIHSKRAPSPPQPAPPSPADTWFATRVPLGTVRGVSARFGLGGRIDAQKNAEIVQGIEKAHIKVFDERNIENFIPRFLTVPHLVRFANISSPCEGEAAALSVSPRPVRLRDSHM
jgi:hypothetical protein